MQNPCRKKKAFSFQTGKQYLQWICLSPSQQFTTEPYNIQVNQVQEFSPAKHSKFSCKTGFLSEYFLLLVIWFSCGRSALAFLQGAPSLPMLYCCNIDIRKRVLHLKLPIWPQLHHNLQITILATSLGGFSCTNNILTSGNVLTLCKP